eukprot:scaffold6828_cov53-Attheya_sp.AAC.4
MNFHPRDDDDAPMELPEELVYHILTFLDVATLVQKKPVCHLWRELCTTAINQKAPIPRMAFETDGEQLYAAVKKYTKYKAHDAEEFAATYGWPMDKWDVSRVEDFSNLFNDKYEFDENIGSWNVSNATRMFYMFDNACCFNQDLSSWDTSNVITMWSMFCNAPSFNQDISSWDTSNVVDMREMFCNATSFNQDISSWDTSNITCICSMFSNATSFNQDISSWDTSNVTDMRRMFYGAGSFNQDISSWDISKVTDMGGMFDGASSFTQDLSSWDISNVHHISRQDISFLKAFANPFPKRRKLRASTESQRRLSASCHPKH